MTNDINLNASTNIHLIYKFFTIYISHLKPDTKKLTYSKTIPKTMWKYNHNITDANRRFIKSANYHKLLKKNARLQLLFLLDYILLSQQYNMSCK